MKSTWTANTQVSELLRSRSRAALTWIGMVLLGVPAMAQSPLRYHDTMDTAPTGATAVAGKLGGAAIPPPAGIRVEAAGHLDKRRGTICLWVQPHWDGGKQANHGLVADEIDFNRIGQGGLYLWHWSVGQLRFDMRVEKLPPVGIDVKAWRAGQWHHVAAAWDCAKGLWLFVDGQPAGHCEGTWEPREASHFRIGANWQGRDGADAVFDDVRIYDRVLGAACLRKVMEGHALPMVAYRGLTAPSRITEEESFAISLQLVQSDPSLRDAKMQVFLDDFDLGEHPFAESVKVIVPRYLHLAAGHYMLRAHIAAALASNEEPASEVTLDVPGKESRKAWSLASDTVFQGQKAVDDGLGLLVDRAFYAGAAAKAKARELITAEKTLDAIPCRLLDKVDCTTTTHDFKENSPSHLVELTPGRQFRIPGPAKEVTEIRNVYGSKQKLLPAYSYRMRTSPRPTPHLLVVESVNDLERNLEVAVDVASGSLPSPVAKQGKGHDVIHLAVVCSGREFPADGKPYRQAFLFFSASDAIEVTVAASGREMNGGPTPGSAVAEMAVYEIARPLSELANPVRTTAKPRHLGLFYPEVMLSFREYGFDGSTPAARQASVRSMMDYLQFLGFDRLEFHPYPFHRKAHFASSVYPQEGKADVLADILPPAQEAGVSVVPRMDSLCFYGDAWKDDSINYQLTAKGKMPDTFGKCPDPLRPPVQRLLLDMLGDMLEKCKGYSCVTGVGFRANAKFGVLYVGNWCDMPPEESGLSAWDIEAFEKATGVRVPADHADPKACHAWLLANAWQRWIDWRCEAMHRWWLEARDLARRYDRELFVRTVIPYSHHFPSEKEAWYGKKQSPLEIFRNHGFDPKLFAEDRGLMISEVFSLGADRYNKGRLHNRAFWHDPRLDGMVRTADGSAVELYYIYWELPSHPKGFRVGPSHMAGRAALEPLTYALRTRNAKEIIFYDWFRATSGIDVELRQFARAYRALPAVEPRAFDGRCEPAPDGGLWIRWFDDRLAVVNYSGQPRTISLVIPAKNGRKLLDVAQGCTAGRREGTAKDFRCTLQLAAYDLRTLVIE